MNEVNQFIKTFSGRGQRQYVIQHIALLLVTNKHIQHNNNKNFISSQCWVNLHYDKSKTCNKIDSRSKYRLSEMHKRRQGTHRRDPREPARQMVDHECQSTSWPFLADHAGMQRNLYQNSHRGWTSPRTTAECKRQIPQSQLNTEGIVQ